MQITTQLMCLKMRSGIEIWMDKERVDRFRAATEGQTQSKMIWFDDEMFNTADIEGVYHAHRIADLTRRRNGQWQCQQGRWHERGEKCECLKQDDREWIRKRNEAIRACGKCTNGFIVNKSGEAELCACQKSIL